MDGYVSKPFEEKQLFQAMKKFLGPSTSSWQQSTHSGVIDWEELWLNRGSYVLCNPLAEDAFWFWCCPLVVAFSEVCATIKFVAGRAIEATKV
jgi:hypothetical protein